MNLRGFAAEAQGRPGAARGVSHCPLSPLSCSENCTFYLYFEVLSLANFVSCLQPVNFVSLGLTAVTAAGLIYLYQHLRDTKLKGEWPAWQIQLMSVRC